MFDSVSFYLRDDREDFTKKLEEKLTNAEAVFQVDTQEGRVKGNLGNLQILASSDWLSVKGSLSKFHLGSNLNSLGRKTTQEAIERLSDSLGVNLNLARVSRLDIAGNFVLQNPVINYLNCMVSAPYLKKGGQPSGNWASVYFFNKSRVVTMYDKLAEMKAKKEAIPIHLHGRNLLRYELRLKKGPRKPLLMDQLTAQDLYQEKVYMKALDVWKSAYDSIVKAPKVKMSADFHTTSKMIEFFALKQIQEQGIQSIMEEIETAALNGAITKLEKSRMKKKIDSLQKHSEQVQPDFTEIAELEKQVQQSIRYYR